MSEPGRPQGWLPKERYDSIFSRVSRLCVEVVIVAPDRGELLMLRGIPPYVGSWQIPGGTVTFAEPLVDAVKRVARDELGLTVEVGELLGASSGSSLARRLGLAPDLVADRPPALRSADQASRTASQGPPRLASDPVGRGAGSRGSQGS